MALEDYFEDLDLQRKSSVDNGIGGEIETWATIGTIRGCINASGSSEIRLAGMLQVTTTHKLLCEPAADIQSSDRIHKNGLYYRVVSDPKNTLNRGHHLKVLLQEVGIDNV